MAAMQESKSPSRPRSPVSCGRALYRILILFLLVAGVACSSKGDRKSVFPVRGKVFMKEKPAVGAFVLFVPVNEPTPPKDPRPRGEVDADGSFSLSTFGANDGAPPGDYAVLITWIPNSRDSDDREDRLQGRYSDPKQPKLRATVNAEPTELPPYKLK